MNALTPFSGLSLITHLLIIGITVLVKIIVKKGGVVVRVPIKVATLWDKHRNVVLPGVSICIIVIIAFWVSASTTIAVRTGLREGALESHSEFIQKRYIYLQGVGKNLDEWNESNFLARRDASKNYTAMSYGNGIFQSTNTNGSYTPVLGEFSINHLKISGEVFSFK